MATDGQNPLLGDEGPLRGRRVFREGAPVSSLGDEPGLSDYEASATADTREGFGWQWDAESDADWWDGLPSWAERLVNGQVAELLSVELEEAGWYSNRPVDRRRLRDPGKKYEKSHFK